MVGYGRGSAAASQGGRIRQRISSGFTRWSDTAEGQQRLHRVVGYGRGSAAASQGGRLRQRVSSGFTGMVGYGRGSAAASQGGRLRQRVSSGFTGMVGYGRGSVAASQGGRIRQRVSSGFTGWSDTTEDLDMLQSLLHISLHPRGPHFLFFICNYRVAFGSTTGKLKDYATSHFIFESENVKVLNSVALNPNLSYI